MGGVGRGSRPVGPATQATRKRPSSGTRSPWPPGQDWSSCQRRVWPCRTGRAAIQSARFSSVVIAAESTESSDSPKAVMSSSMVSLTGGQRLCFPFLLASWAHEDQTAGRREPADHEQWDQRAAARELSVAGSVTVPPLSMVSDVGDELTQHRVHAVCPAAAGRPRWLPLVTWTGTGCRPPRRTRRARRRCSAGTSRRPRCLGPLRRLREDRDEHRRTAAGIWSERSAAWCVGERVLRPGSL